MFTVFIIKQNQRTIYITTPDYFSRVLQGMQIMQDDVIWHNVSMESLIRLKDKQSRCIVLVI